MIPAMIVPVLTRPELLYRMIDSIDHKVAHLIVIDNGRVVADWECDTNPEVQRVSVIHMPANLGVDAVDHPVEQLGSSQHRDDHRRDHSDSSRGRHFSAYTVSAS